MNHIATVLVVFGTRPEVIKLLPVLRALEKDPRLRVIRLSTGQQADLVPSFLESFGIIIDAALDLPYVGRSLNEMLGNMVAALDGALERYNPTCVVVQGDTSTALAGALSARYCNVPVIHIEAGLRTGDLNSPFPEESNRKLISQLASLHLAPTRGNVAALINEGIRETDIVLTGNPVIDAIQWIMGNAVPSAQTSKLLQQLSNSRIIALTAHRRENLGDRLNGYFKVIKDCIEKHPDVVAVFPVHPNPSVQQSAVSILGNVDRIKLIEPLTYADFYSLLRSAWLVVSDSGGVQEEVVTLGKPLLVIRDKTERPEAIECGNARLTPTPQALAEALEVALKTNSWCSRLSIEINPFGDGNSGPRIAAAISHFLFDATQADC